MYSCLMHTFSQFLCAAIQLQENGLQLEQNLLMSQIDAITKSETEPYDIRNVAS